MLIESIFNSFYNFLFEILFDNVYIEPLDSINGIISVINQMFTYGYTIYKYFFPPFAQVLLNICLGSELLIDLYYFVRWIYKKIPFLNMD